MTTTPHHPARVGLIVDVQNDFMLPAAEGGRLYVHHLSDPSDPGAVQVVESLGAAARWMLRHCDAVVYTGDWHAYGDREIDTVAPDPARETYPPHCMGLSDDAAEREGAALHPSVRPPGDDVVVLARDASVGEAERAARAAVDERRPVFVQKSEFSVFAGNAAADAFFRALAERLGGTPEWVVCGVATDVCVRHAVEGLLERGQRVTVLEDAVWGLGLIGREETLERWRREGARLASIREVAGVVAA